MGGRLFQTEESLVFYKKPSARPSTKTFSVFGHVFVQKFLQSFSILRTNLLRKRKQNMNVASYLSYNKQNVSVKVKF